MDLTEANRAIRPPSWDARLELEYAWREGRTVLARREHCGPLRVQRDLYPEGQDTCHTIIVHPPGGIAGGDTLTLNAELGASSAALLTTPGAGKWYRSIELPARQTLDFKIGADASLEWLPQETIVFDGAQAGMQTRVCLAERSLYLGWEILCLGRRASGERFAHGTLQLGTEIWKEGKRLWTEQGQLSGDDPLTDSPIGLAGHTVCATLTTAGHDINNETLAACREVAHGENALAGITRLLPNLLIARWLGDSDEDARHYFVKLWAVLRPALRNRAAEIPRIWAT